MAHILSIAVSAGEMGMVGVRGIFLGLAFVSSVAFAADEPPSGTMQGSFEVADSGLATYSIPISVPPGAGGMAPQLGFSYSSDDSNGLMGVGWALSGLSQITRCPMTYAQDDKLVGVRMDASDKLCLDGQRLILFKGTYGKANAEYRTEIDQFSKIVEVNDISSSSSYFKVYTKSGEINEYGKGNASFRVPKSDGSLGAIRAWSVSRFSDTAGNYITVNYARDSNTREYYPSSMNYTGNSRAGVSPPNNVRFTYDKRPDPQVAYTTGGSAPVTLSRRLTKVETFTRSQTKAAASYRISYVDSTIGSGRSRVSSIQQCGLNQCFPATRFTWRNTSQKVTYRFKELTIDNPDPDRRVMLGDWNGDGFTDYLIYNPKTGSNYWKINNGGAEYGYTDWASNPLPREDVNDNSGSLHFGDWNGDGRTDVMWLHKDDGRNRWYVNQGNGTFKATYNPIDPNQLKDAGIRIVDFNNDGLADLVSSRGKNSRWFASQSTSGVAFKAAESPVLPTGAVDGTIFFGDFNGDQLTDVVMVSKKNSSGSVKSHARVVVYLNSGVNAKKGFPTYAPASNAEPYTIAPSDETTGEIAFGDWNGDGLTDLLWSSNDGKSARFHLSKGDGGFVYSADTSTGSYSLNGIIQTGDWNGDGLDDVSGYDRSGGDNDWFVNTGRFAGNDQANFSKFSDPVSKEYVDDNTGSVQFGDWNGDGFIDFSWYNANNGKIRFFTNSNARKEVITDIKNGLGANIHIDYLPMTDDAVYSKTTTVSYPQIALLTPALVVRRFAKTNSTGGMSSTAFAYANMIYDLEGRGSIGFAQITKTNDQSGVSTQTKYYTTFPKVGLWASRFTTYKRSGTVYKLSSESQNVNVSSVKAAEESFYRVYPTKNSTTIYDSDPSSNNVIKGQTVETTQNTYGEVTSMSTRQDGLNQTSVTTSVTNTYDDDLAKWHLGRLTKTVVKMTSGSSSVTRTSAFEYADDTGLLTSETAGVGTPLAKTTKYTYDKFGNKTSALVSTAYDGQTREVKTKYDANGVFAISSINPLGHTASASYDPNTGKQLTATDANGLKTTWMFDSFGRQTRQDNPDGTWETIEYIGCSASLCPIGGKMSIRTIRSDHSQTRTAIDSNENTISTSTIGARGTSGTPIDTTTEFDNLDRPIRVTAPYYRGDKAFATTTTYDILDRPVSVTSPLNETSGTETERMTYSGLSTTRIDANGRSTTTDVDAAGRTSKVTDALGNSLAYVYDAAGNLRQVTDASGNVVKMTYDTLGNKIAMDDPDMGRWTYRYNGFGELIAQTDARGRETKITYDALGRVISRQTRDGADRWEYDVAWKGAPDREVSADGFEKSYNYDTLGRPTSEATKIDGTTYTLSQAYDSQSRVSVTTYPNGFKTQNAYNTVSGQLLSVKNVKTGKVYWKANARDAASHVTSIALGNGLVTALDYDQARGYITSILTGQSTGTEVQSLNYTWDKVGNLTSRTDQNQNGAKQSFSYDALYRLTKSAGAGTDQTIHYDVVGNITSKTGIGSYTYGDKPHAVTQTSGTRNATYSYDANGNMLTAGERSLKWTAFNKLRVVARTTMMPADLLSDDGTLTVENSSAFYYDAAQMKFKEVRRVKNNAGERTQTIAYIGNLYEKRTDARSTETRAYVFAEGKVVATEKTVSGAAAVTEYEHDDVLGSVTAITDSSGEIVQQMAYDPWGKRTALNWNADNSDSLMFNGAYPTDRGFTGHDQLDNVGFVDMNARLYDPALGRFLSADTIVQFPDSTQGYNRYTYVNNNPLSYTDPSGHGLFSAIKKAILKPISKFAGKNPLLFQIAMIAVIPSPTSWWIAAATGFGSGFVASGGDLKAGLIGGATAAAFYGVGTNFTTKPGESLTGGQIAAKAVSHGIVGGVSSELSGRSFKDGFVGASVAGAFAGSFSSNTDFGQSIGYSGRIVTAAVIGGTASELSGGKFANGAVTAAFAQAYNDEHRPGRENRLTKAQAIALGRAAGQTKLAIEAMSVDQMRDTFSSLRGDPAGQVGLSRYAMLRSLTAMQVESLQVVLTDGMATVVDAAVGSVILLPAGRLSDISTVMTIKAEAATVIQANKTDFRIGCNRYGCAAAGSQ